MQGTRIAIIGAALWALLAAPLEAALILSGTIGGVNICATDQNVVCTFGTQLPDTNATPGLLGLGTTTTPILVGGLEIFGSLQEQTIGPPLNVLSSSSLSVTNATGAAVSGSLAVGAPGYQPPALVAFATGSGVWQGAAGSTLTMTWYNDPTNTQGADTPDDRPGLLLATFTDTATGPVDSFATGTLGPFAVNDPALFAMTQAVDFTLTAGGVLLNRGQSEVKPVDVGQAIVPEPATIVLVGAGLLALTRRRR